MSRFLLDTSTSSWRGFPASTRNSSDRVADASGPVRSVVGVWPAAALFSERYRREHPAEVAAYMPYFARHRAPPWMTGWQTLAAACFGRRESLRRVRAPALVLHGALDAVGERLTRPFSLPAGAVRNGADMAASLRERLRAWPRGG